MAEQVIRACNAKPVTVHVKQQVGDREITVVDPEATAAEQLCRDNLTEALQVWCWADPERATRLAGRYNRLFNRYRAEQWDGSHLTLPGLAADFTARPHQKDVVWRILASADRGVLMAHGVGAGKTAAMIIAAQETRRTGRIDGTALFAVPGNMVEQFARDYLRLYPAARVLTPHGATQRDAVREFAARMATGDFDAAVCSHNQLKTIPLSPDVEPRCSSGASPTSTRSTRPTTLSRSAARRWARQLEKEKARLAELKKAVEDPAVTYFDRMGVGMLVVDEAHLAKNIRLNTQRQGLPMPAGSQRAEAILARTDYVRSRHGDGAIVMATATPVTNSPAEMWVAARLVAPHALADAGLDHFDAMAANFLAPVETVEHGADGKLQRRHPPRRVQELPRPGPHVPLVRRRAHHRLARLRPARPRRRQSHRARRRPHPATRDGRRLVRRAGRPPAHRRRRRDPRPGHRHLGHRPSRRPAPGHDLARRRATSTPPTAIPDLRFSWDEPNEKLITVAERIAEIHHRTADWTYPGLRTARRRPGRVLRRRCPQPRRVTVGVLDAHRPAHRTGRRPQPDRLGPRHHRPQPAPTVVGPGPLRPHPDPDRLDDADGRRGQHPDPALRRPRAHRPLPARLARTSRRPPHPPRQQQPDRRGAPLRHRTHRRRQLVADPATQSPLHRPSDVGPRADDPRPARRVRRHRRRGVRHHRRDRHRRPTPHRTRRAHRRRRPASSAPSAPTTPHATPKAARSATPNAASAGSPTRSPPSTRSARTTPTPSCIGQRLLAMRWNERTTLQLAGVTYDAHRYDGIRLEIPGTGIWTRIDGDRLHPEDEGRGLGQRILNLHDRLPTERAEQVERIERARRQIDAERARPVPAEFPRRSRAARDPATTRPAARRPDAQTRTGRATAGADGQRRPTTADRSTSPSRPRAGHPVFGQPATAHRGTLRLGRPPTTATTPASSCGATEPAVPTRGPLPSTRSVSTRPTGTPPDDTTSASSTASTSRPASTTPPSEIEPRHAYAKNGNYPTFTAHPGRVDPNRLSAWLDTMRSLAVTERNELRHHVQPYNGASGTEQQPRFER